MGRRPVLIVAAAGFLLTFGVCYGPAIAGRQFSYRDAAHYYYPLYQRVQAEWEANRVPLWEPEENAGMPLLGNPTAAVLYPGKLIYTFLSYPLAARVYVMAHTLIAFVGTLMLSRRLAIGRVGAVIAGLSYAFAGPILFQYCNIIFLVGAAWVPWAIAAVDAWLRGGDRRAIPTLAVVLALQVLGGDPQAAYIEGLCGFGYAVALHRRETTPSATGLGRRALMIALGVVAVAAWAGVTLYLAAVLPTIRPFRANKMPLTFGWSKYVPTVFAGVWLVGGAWFLRAWIARRATFGAIGRRLVGLGLAGALAGALAGSQLLPVLEFTRQTGRAADESTHDIYPFSLEPYRVAELVWPGIFGTTDRGNRSWLLLIPPATSHRIWVPSLYLGGATIVLAIAGLAARGGPPWKGWIVGIVGVSLIAAMGEFAGPLWVARNVPSVAAVVGPHDPARAGVVREDGYLRDGEGSVYSLLAAAIPGFQQFRYPSKLLTFTMLGLAVLAGHGWDVVESGRRRAAIALAATLGAASLAILVAVSARFDALLEILRKTPGNSSLGPFDAEGCLRDVRGALWHGSVVFGVTVVALVVARRRPRLAGLVVIAAVAIDLGAANRGMVITCDQAVFDRVPKAVKLIAEAERENPARGPYRVHRMPLWNPIDWYATPSSDRVGDFVRWESDTLQPKYGLTHGVEYTHTQGVAELYDYEWYFAPWTTPNSPRLAEILRVDPKERIVYYPRRGFDLWNTRYFILPGLTRWTDAERGVVSLVHDTERVYPPPDAFKGPGGKEREEDWLRREDMQIVRNRNAFPRAWVVHDARFSRPIDGLGREERTGPMEEMLYAADPFWNYTDRVVHDPKAIAWFEVANPAPLTRYIARGPTGAGEAVTIVRRDPRRVELATTLERPGFVILADAYYPGWELTIDGKPTPVLRANRMMRGAAVEAGKHTLIYTYRPRSFTYGMITSAAGLVGLAGALAWTSRRGIPAPSAARAD